MKPENLDETPTKLYKLRWVILVLFVSYCCAIMMQFVQYSIITNVIMKYYGVSSLAVNWTTMIPMLLYPLLVIPGCYLIDRMGLRFCMLLGVTIMTVGTWMKVFSVAPDRFWLGFLGQTVVFIAQIFVLALPSKVAAVWFGKNEVSTATSIGTIGTQLGTAIGFVLPPLLVKNHENLQEIGNELSILFYSVAIFITPLVILMFMRQTVVFIAQIFVLALPSKVAAVWFGKNEVSTATSIGTIGTQLGTAIGFVLPPLLVKNHENLQEIGNELSILFYSVAIFITPLVILMFMLFKPQPKLPPTVAQAYQRRNAEKTTRDDYWNRCKQLMTQKGYVLLIISFGMNLGGTCALFTFLNQITLSYFENGERDAGLMGLLFVASGITGSMIFGVILDKTKRFKESAVLLYVTTAIATLVFAFALETRSKIFVYMAICSLGFFQSAYLPVSFEFAAELTYPQPESMSCGIITSFGQGIGVFFTLLMGKILEDVGAFWAITSMVPFFTIGVILTILIPNDLKRLSMNKIGENEIENL